MKDLRTVITILITLLLTIYFFSSVPIFPGLPSAVAQSSNTCKIFYEKAKKLAGEGAEDLPERQTLNFDPRIAKSKASLAYSQIYKNCKAYGE